MRPDPEFAHAGPRHSARRRFGAAGSSRVASGYSKIAATSPGSGVSVSGGSRKATTGVTRIAGAGQVLRQAAGDLAAGAGRGRPPPPPRAAPPPPASRRARSARRGRRPGRHGMDRRADAQRQQDGRARDRARRAAPAPPPSRSAPPAAAARLARRRRRSAIGAGQSRSRVGELGARGSVAGDGGTHAAAGRPRLTRPRAMRRAGRLVDREEHALAPDAEHLAAVHRLGLRPARPVRRTPRG